MRRVTAWFAALLLGAAVAAPAADDAAGIRPGLESAYRYAQDMLDSGEYRVALNTLVEIEADAELTSYERYLLHRLRAVAATAADDAPLAIDAYRAALASRWMEDHDRLPVLDAVARLALRAGRYDDAAQAVRDYLRAGGRDSSTTALLAQALFGAGHYADAARRLRHEIAEDKRADTPPAEARLHLLAHSELGAGSDDGYLAALRKLAAYYPTPEVWTHLILRTAAVPGFSDRYALDVYRLRLHTGTMQSAGDYVEATQLALQVGLSAEAARFVQRGYAGGVLGRADAIDAERHERLRQLVVRRLAEDRGQLAATPPDADLDSADLLREGLNLVTWGEHDAGLVLMRRGVETSDPERRDAALLRYGYAQILSGDNSAARETLREVGGDDGSAALARLWIIAGSD